MGIYKSDQVKPGSMSMCGLADAEGGNGFQECSHKSCSTVERASCGCKSRGWAFSLASATTLPYNNPPVNPISPATRSPSPSPSISPRNLTLWDQLQHSGALRRAMSALPVAGDFQSHYRGRGWVHSTGTEREEKMVYLAVEEGYELKWCNSVHQDSVSEGVSNCPTENDPQGLYSSQ